MIKLEEPQDAGIGMVHYILICILTLIFISMVCYLKYENTLEPNQKNEEKK